MDENKTIFEIEIEYADKRRVKFYATGNYGCFGTTFGDYFDGKDSLNIINAVINRLEYGHGRYGEDFTLVSYREIGEVLLDYSEYKEEYLSKLKEKENEKKQ